MSWRTAFCRTCCAVALAALAMLFLSTISRADEAIDWSRARELHQRAERGEQLSPEEQAYLNRAVAEHDRQVEQGGQANGPGSSTRPGAPATRESTGMTPLSDFKAEEKYKGEGGGLYPDGGNVPSGDLARLAAALCAKVTPLDAAGQPARNGRIVLLSIGMSNTTMEFSRFKRMADDDADKSPLLSIVDGAQGGKDSRAWVGASREGVWATADKRLDKEGVTPRQVQVLWIKQACINPGGIGEFPRHSDALRDDWAQILTLAKARYPNVRLAFCSSRIYAGYARTALNPEPFAYESAYAVRGLIAEQASDAALNADPARGEVKAPLALWGPYLWADGVKGRAIDDLVWQPADFGGVGTHPSPAGCQKVAAQLLKFFKTDANAKPWFVKAN